MRRMCLALSVSVLVSVAVPSVSEATIVVQRGMKGVRLGMTADDVRRVLGRPDKVGYPRHPILGSFKLYRYGATTISIHRSRSGTVFNLTTTSRRERTANGIGVGSSERAVDHGVRGSRCRTEFGYRHCYVGSYRPGRRVTDFAISRTGRVKRITIGFVID